ncbi:MAG: ribosome maturation factor RimP [Bryobacteraceae bacterium]
MKNPVAARVEHIVERVAAPEGIEVVDVELKGTGRNRLLRISIDKASGVTHADCELVSHHVGTLLDVEDVVPGGSYTLEVSSPGVERKLVKLADFQRFQGKKARIVLSEPVEGSSHWEGILAGVSGSLVRLSTSPERTIAFPFERVSRANLKFEW